VSPKDGPRDWDKELADIDKLIASGPSPAPAQVPAKGGARPSAAPAAAPRAASGGRRERIASAVWFLLAALMGVGLTFLWPYERTCGLGLYGYVGSIGLFGLASMWSTIWSWRTRSAAVHFLSIALLGWSAFLGAREILPRVGYAKQGANWECGVRRVAPAARTQPPAQPDAPAAQTPATNPATQAPRTP